MSLVFAGVFLWYPGFCTRAFEMLQCRTVYPAYTITASGVTKTIDSIERLAVDFSVDCDTGLYAAHNAKAALSRGRGWVAGGDANQCNITSSG